MPKAGSTSIQDTLARAELCGALRPVRYPLLGRELNHRRFPLHYLPFERWEPWERLWFPAKGSPQPSALQCNRYIRPLFDQLRGTDCAILSSEMLHRLSAVEAGGFRRDLEDVGFRQFRVVFYIRDPADRYLSRVQTALQLTSRLRNPVSYRDSFRDVVQAWEESFPGCVMVRRFSADANFDVVEDFSAITKEFLGVGLPQAQARSNVSVSAEGMEILQRYRSAFWPGSDGLPTPDTVRLVALLRQSKTAIAQTRPELRPEIATWIRAHHRDDVAFIAERYGVDLQVDCGGSLEPLGLDADDLRVADVVDHVDNETVTELLLWMVKAELNRHPDPRALLVRMANRVLMESRVRISARRRVRPTPPARHRRPWGGRS